MHDEAPRPEDTDWPQILGLYDLLEQPSRPARWSRSTGSSPSRWCTARGPAWTELAAAEADPALAGHHRVDAVRAHLLDLAGDHEAARAHYELAARRTLSVPEQRYLESRAAQLDLP